MCAIPQPEASGEITATQTTLAGLPDIVRGYEDVKAGNVATYVAEVSRQAAAVGIDPQLGNLASQPAPDAVSYRAS